MKPEISVLPYIFIFGLVTVILLIFIVYISDRRSKKTSSQEAMSLKDGIERLSNRLSAREAQLQETLDQRSELDEALRKAQEEKNKLKQEYEKKLQDPIRLKELEIIRDENQKLNSRLSAKEQELSKALAQKEAAEEAFKKASEDKGVLKQEYDKELQGLVDRKEFERLQEDNQRLNSQALVKEAEFSKIAAQKTAFEEAMKKAAEEEAAFRREYENKLQGLIDRKEADRLREENHNLNIQVTAKEQELIKVSALKSAVEAAFREISSKKGKEQEEKTKEVLAPEIIQRFEEEQKRLNAQISTKDEEIKKLNAQNSATAQEIAQIKSEFSVEHQKQEAQAKQKEKELTQALEEKSTLAQGLSKKIETMVDKATLDAVQEALAAEKTKGEEALAGLKQEYEKKLQNTVERKEFDRLREENQKLNAEIIAKAEQVSVSLEEKKPAVKKPAKQTQEAESSKAKIKDQLEPVMGFKEELPKDLIPYVTEQEKKIGGLLKSNGLVEESVWQKAQDYQKQHPGSSLILYLLAYDYLKEDQLAESLCDYFKIPYLPLSKYEIPEDVIKQIPQDIMEKYLVIPVFKSGNIINVVMGNPFDAKAIRAVEDTTGCKVRPFVGLFSEIISTIKIYVRFKSEGSAKYPFFVETKSYTGLERRESVRIDAALDIEYLSEGGYKRSVTKNVSRDGFCFESESSIPAGSIFPIMVYLPVHINPLPIKVITKVVKIITLAENKFEIRLHTAKIAKEDMNKIMEFASAGKDKH